MGKEVEVEGVARICTILLVIVPELQQGVALFSQLSLRTWDLKCGPVIISKTELSTCLGVSGSGTASKPNPEHHPLLFAPS